MNMNQISNNKIDHYLNSLEISKMINKKHKNFLRDIRNHIKKLAELKINTDELFVLSYYLDKNNQKRPCFNISKRGCEFIASKLKNEISLNFTKKYISSFNKKMGIKNDLNEYISYKFESIGFKPQLKTSDTYSLTYEKENGDWSYSYKIIILFNFGVAFFHSGQKIRNLKEQSKNRYTEDVELEMRGLEPMRKRNKNSFSCNYLIKYDQLEKLEAKIKEFELFLNGIAVTENKVNEEYLKGQLIFEIKK